VETQVDQMSNGRPARDSRPTCGQRVYRTHCQLRERLGAPTEVSPAGRQVAGLEREVHMLEVLLAEPPKIRDPDLVAVAPLFTQNHTDGSEGRHTGDHGEGQDREPGIRIHSGNPAISEDRRPGSRTVDDQVQAVWNRWAHRANRRARRSPPGTRPCPLTAMTRAGRSRLPGSQDAGSLPVHIPNGSPGQPATARGHAGDCGPLSEELAEK
jgi:hypothetical protein